MNIHVLYNISYNYISMRDRSSSCLVYITRRGILTIPFWMNSWRSTEGQTTAAMFWTQFTIVISRQSINLGPVQYITYFQTHPSIYLSNLIYKYSCVNTIANVQFKFFSHMHISLYIRPSIPPASHPATRLSTHLPTHEFEYPTHV
jgi:hypothetical protein